VGVQVLWRTSLESSSFAIDFLGGAAFLAAGFLGAFWKSSSLALGLALLPPPPLLLLLGAALPIFLLSASASSYGRSPCFSRNSAAILLSGRCS